jgi:hypothetical protein
MNQMTNEEIRATMRAEFAAKRAAHATTKPASTKTHVDGYPMSALDETIDRILFVAETIVDRFIVTPLYGEKPPMLASAVNDPMGD